MGSYSVEQECRVDPGLALARAGEALVRNGYEIASRSANELNLFYRAGSITAARLDEHRHRLKIHADGSRLTFTFEAGVSSHGLIIQSERDALEERVATAMRAAGLPAPGAARRCTTCGTLSNAGESICAVCGSML